MGLSKASSSWHTSDLRSLGGKFTVDHEVPQFGHTSGSRFQSLEGSTNASLSHLPHRIRSARICHSSRPEPVPLTSLRIGPWPCHGSRPSLVHARVPGLTAIETGIPRRGDPEAEFTVLPTVAPRHSSSTAPEIPMPSPALTPPVAQLPRERRYLSVHFHAHNELT